REKTLTARSDKSKAGTFKTYTWYLASQRRNQLYCSYHSRSSTSSNVSYCRRIDILLIITIYIYNVGWLCVRGTGTYFVSIFLFDHVRYSFVLCVYLCILTTYVLRTYY
ncbi:unnamed protein product, partial [Laminaria digitata]